MRHVLIPGEAGYGRGLKGLGFVFQWVTYAILGAWGLYHLTQGWWGLSDTWMNLFNASNILVVHGPMLLLMLTQRNRSSAPIALVFGMALGLVLAMITVLFPHGRDFVPFTLYLLPLFLVAGAVTQRRGAEFDRCLIAPVSSAILASLVWLVAYWMVFASGHGRAVPIQELVEFYSNCFYVLFLFPLLAFCAGLVGGLFAIAWRRTTWRGLGTGNSSQ